MGRAGRWLIAALGLLAGCQVNPELLRQMQAGSAAAARRSEAARETASAKPALAQAMARVNDEARIAFAASVNGSVQIYSVQPDGSRAIQLTTDPGFKCRPSWSPDHQRIAYFHFTGDKAAETNVGVVVMQANGSEAREALKGKKINVSQARIGWRPDGSVMYLAEKDFPTILFGYSLATGEQVETIRLPKTSFLREVHTISPDLERLAGAGPAKSGQAWHIGTVRRNGAEDTDLMKPFFSVPFHVGTVVWSYDGGRVAFELDNLVVMMTSSFRPGFQASPLTPQDTDAALTGPAFSPSGQYLACILEKSKEGTIGVGDREVSSDVWVMNANGANQHQITRTGTCFDPHW